MREGTYPPGACLSTASNPKAGSWVLCPRTLLWVRRLSPPWASTGGGNAPAAGSGRGGRRAEGERESTRSRSHQVFVGSLRSKAGWLQVFAC